MTNIFGLDKENLTYFFSKQSEKPFRTKQLLKWMHQQGVIDFQQMSNLPLKLRNNLADLASIQLPQVINTQISNDGAVKWLFKLYDDNIIESVFIPEHNRGTLCISSQVGCYLNCSFCVTGLQGFNRNLTSDEIIAQLWLAREQLKNITQQTSWQQARWRNQTLSTKISNVVFMGMGEPLLNTKNVIPAINLMLNDDAYGLSKRRVTISTAGVAPMITKLPELCQASLAVSLHSAINKKRDILVPLNKKYPIKQLLDSCWNFVKNHTKKRHILFEYVMLKGINDSATDAKALISLIKDFPSKVNLIPFNSYPGLNYESSSIEAIEKFRNYLRHADINTTTRKTRGKSIDAACGQLAGKVSNRIKQRQQTIFLPLSKTKQVKV